MQELFKNVRKVLTADRLGAFFIAPDSVSPTPLLLPGHFANEQTTFLVLQYHSFCFRSHMSGVAPWKCARASEKAGLQFFALPQPASGAEDTDPGRPSQMGRRHHCVHGKSSSSSQRNGSIKRLIREADFELLRGIQRTAYNQQVVSGIRKSPTTGQAEELLAGQDRDCPPRLPSPGHKLH